MKNKVLEKLKQELRNAEYINRVVAEEKERENEKGKAEDWAMEYERDEVWGGGGD